MTELHALTGDGEPIVIEADAVQSLQRRLRGGLICAGDARYDETRQVWNKMIDKRPTLIVCCHGAADVMTAVNFAREYQLLVSVRGGGHNVAGLAVCDGGLMIDLSPMRGVWVDPVARVAHVQGGAVWRDVDFETQAFGLATPGGIVSHTGVAGYTLGGGYGWLRGKYGLACDCLRSVDIVTADGQLRRASPKQNADLFWGIQGGGGNFGIVTSFEFELFPVGPEVLFCAVQHLAQDASSVLKAWRNFMVTAPDEYTSEVGLARNGEMDHIPADLRRRKTVNVTGAYFGDPAQGRRLLEPLRTMGNPVQDNTRTTTYLALQTQYDEGFRKGTALNYWKSIYLADFSDAVIDLIVDWYEQCPIEYPIIYLRYLSGALCRVAPEATAFGDRSDQLMVSIDSVWQDPAESERNIAWTRAFWQALQPYSSGKTYYNFGGLMEEDAGLMRTTFGANYERLVALKNQYDPANLFRLNQNIKPRGDHIAERGL